jgi:hypothetical protein
MPDTLDAAELRRLAMECASMAAADGCAATERERLLTMRESLLALAASADWLDGKTPMQPTMQ